MEALQGNPVVEGAIKPVDTGGSGAVGAMRRPWRVGLQGR